MDSVFTAHWWATRVMIRNVGQLHAYQEYALYYALMGKHSWTENL